MVNWNMNSCRYDAFLFIYANMIMNNLKIKSKINCILCFNKIGEILLNINETGKKLGFWNIIHKFNLDSIGILNDNNNPQILESINSVFKFFNKADEFCIKYIVDRKSDLCSYNMSFEEYYQHIYLLIVLI